MYISTHHPSPLLPIIPTVFVAYQKQVSIGRPRGFRLKQITWVAEGEMWVSIGGEKRVLKKGQGFFFNSNVPHSYGDRTKGQLYVNYLVFDGGNDLLEYFGVKDCFFFDMPENINSDYDELKKYASNTELLVLHSAAAYKWMTELFASLFTVPHTASDKIDVYIEKNYGKPITLDDIAEKLKTDKYILCREYKKARGKTIMEALKYNRIKKAKRLLWQTTMSVEEVGVMCGFTDSSYFIKNFKDVTGITPKKYRTDKSMPSQDEYPR